MKLKFATFAEKNWHPIWSSKTSPRVHGSEATKNKNEVRGVPLKWNTAVSVAKFLKFMPEVFQTNEVTEPQRSQTKTKWSIPWLSTRSAVTGSAVENTCIYTCTYEVWNYSSTHAQTKSDYSAEGIRDPERHEMSLKCFLCDVHCHHIGWIRSTSHLLDWNNTRSNKFFDEKESKLNMFHLLWSSKLWKYTNQRNTFSFPRPNRTTQETNQSTSNLPTVTSRSSRLLLSTTQPCLDCMWFSAWLDLFSHWEENKRYRNKVAKSCDIHSSQFLPSKT